MKDLLTKIDSEDGLFHNGNPATGTAGTRVNDVWLNDVQASLRDVGGELSYLLSKANMRPVPSDTTQVYKAIKQIIGAERPLYSGYDKNDESLGATAKAVNVLKGFIDSNTRNFANYIPNSKKSNAVNSSSADNVATSVAVKTAYDKGVEAKTAADKAQRTADEKVSKSGDTMTGELRLEKRVVRFIKNNELLGYAGVPSPESELIRLCSNKWNSYIELQNGKVVSPQPYYVGNDKVALETWVNNSFVKKTGDTMTGTLQINAADSYVRGQRSGKNIWYVGTTSSSSEDVALNNYAKNTSIQLQDNQVAINKDLQLPNEGAVVFGSNNRNNKNVDHIHFSDGDNQPGTYYFCADAAYKGKEANSMADIATGWLRTYGNKGWYSQTYGGGWCMTDSTWIRSYGNKKVYTGNSENDAFYTLGGVRANNGFYWGSQSLDNRYLKQTGGTLTGVLELNYNNGYSQINQHNKDGKHARIEVTPDNSNAFYQISYRTTNPDKPIHVVYFAKKSGTVALLDDIKNNVVVLSGYIVHGGTIPLPNGFTESQCKWMVSMNSDNPTSSTWDIFESGAHMHYRFECYAHTRKVTAKAYHNGSEIVGVANYIIIGVK
ncbi:shufflon system plasmid conjugative transfer pilus tip adhesin PilV [Lonepinella sp. BR2474]|uniref:shufflon system plasmid conjugative transfer pilus tip adhesin PilV n=1 Tax=Lonepinella sp. BR2474 TaxID=3434548 RepID=UPI003F6DA7B6